MTLSKHPVDEKFASLYHGMLAGFLLLGVIFHAYSAIAHFQERNRL